jgi:hypothetical protein
MGYISILSLVCTKKTERIPKYVVDRKPNTKDAWIQPPPTTWKTHTPQLEQEPFAT